MSLVLTYYKVYLLFIPLIISTNSCSVNECLGDCGTPKETISELIRDGISLGVRPKTAGFKFVSGAYGENSDGYISGNLGIIALPDKEYESRMPSQDSDGTSRDYHLGGRNIVYFSRYENGIEIPLDSRLTYCGGSEDSTYSPGETVFDPTMESVFASSRYSEYVDEKINHVLVKVTDYCIPKSATHIVHRVVGNDLKTTVVRSTELVSFSAWNELVR